MVQQTTGYKIQMFVLFQRTRSLMLGKYTVLPINRLMLKAQIFTMEEAYRICQNFTVSVLYLILEVFSQEYQSTKSRNRRLHMFFVGNSCNANKLLPNPSPVEEEVRFFQVQDKPIVTTQVRVGNRVFSHSLDVVSKMYILVHIIYSHFSPAQYQKRCLKLITHCFLLFPPMC